MNEWIETYLGDLQISASPATVRGYSNALRRFAAWFGDREASELTADLVLAYARSVYRDKLAPATCDLYASVVVSLCRWLVQEHLLDLPLHEIELRVRKLHGRRPRALPRVPADSAITAIIAAARNAPQEEQRSRELGRLRNIALVETLRGTGMRVSEVVSLRCDDLDRETRSARIIGKGGKDRLVCFTVRAWRAIKTYLAARGDHDDNQPVFARHDPVCPPGVHPLSTTAVREVITQLATTAGITAPISPHRFRAWFATHILETTGDLAATQDLLGHASPITTRIYAQVRSGRLQAVHAKAFDEEAL